MASSWLQLAPILRHLVEILLDPSPAKIDQNQPRQLLKDFWCQGRPQDLPDPLQTSIFKDFGMHFSIFLVNFSKDSFIDSAFDFNAVLKDFSSNLFCSTLLERSRREGGGGTRPQGVFDISAAPAKRVTGVCKSRL